jgi:hypothetical protein
MKYFSSPRKKKKKGIAFSFMHQIRMNSFDINLKHAFKHKIMPRRGNYSIIFESISEKKLMESMNESRIFKIKKL